VGETIIPFKRCHNPEVVEYSFLPPQAAQISFLWLQLRFLSCLFMDSLVECSAGDDDDDNDDNSIYLRVD
jgi:hypothetical protein